MHFIILTDSEDDGIYEEVKLITFLCGEKRNKPFWGNKSKSCLSHGFSWTRIPEVLNLSFIYLTT